MDPRAYIRLARQLENDIEDGTLAAGTPAPTITFLVQQTGHARQTCGKALQRLEDKGLLQRYAGLGYYVRQPGRTANATGTAPVKTAPDPASQTGGQHIAPARDPGPRTPPTAPVIFRPPARSTPHQDQPPAFTAPVTAVPAAPGTPHNPPPGKHYDFTASPGDQLQWILVPEDASGRAAAQLAAHYKTTVTLAGWTSVPPRWLHITVGCAGPADDLTAAELARMTGIVRERCRRLPQLTITAAPAQVTPAGLICPVGPAAALRGLQTITATACTAIGRTFPAPRKPHIVLASAAGDAAPGQAGPPSLPASGKLDIRETALLLARVQTDGQHLTWRTMEKITMGRVRGRPS